MTSLTFPFLRQKLLVIGGVAVLFLTALKVNDLLFLRFEHAPGINYFYLPAGIRLLSTLLAGGTGAIGLLLVSWYVSFFHFFPDNPSRAFMGGILASLAPYLVYRAAAARYGFHTSLSNLSPFRLLMLSFLYAIASPLLHHIWFWIHGDDADLLGGFLAMGIGDFTGTLIVLYAFKALLRLLPTPR